MLNIYKIYVSCLYKMLTSRSVIRIRTEGPSDRSPQRAPNLYSYQRMPSIIPETSVLPRPNHYPVWNSSTEFECDLIGETGVASVTRVKP